MTIRRSSTPIWGRPEPGSRRPRFSRDQIAAVALRIADDEGFGAVSMRRIAQELGAGTMTLYSYLESKDDLIALMDDALMGESLVPQGELPQDWREAVATIARRTRAALECHPWALQTLHGAAAVQPAPVGPNAMGHFEQCLAALADAPLTTADKLDLLAIVDAFVFGHALSAGELQLRAGTDPAEAQELIAYGEAQVASGRYPRLAGLASEPEAVAAIADPGHHQERFERGLRSLIDGFAGRARGGARGRRGPALEPAGE